jgi:predicted MFS family arabinose efflux permease
MDRFARRGSQPATGLRVGAEKGRSTAVPGKRRGTTLVPAKASDRRSGRGTEPGGRLGKGSFMQRERHQNNPAAPGAALMVMALLPFGFGYFLSYLYRATNAVVAPDLVRDVGLTASELGLLTAAYLLSFSLFQIPLGILLDRYGPRRVQSALVALGALGALLFALGRTSVELLLARAIIGVAFSGGLMASFKAVVIWVPEQRRPLANALVMSTGAIGLLMATAPLEAAVQAIGWRAVFQALAAITLLVSAIILFVVPERPGPARQSRLAAELAEVWSIARDRVFIAMAPLLAITSGAHIAIQTLWAGPWFRDIAGLDRTSVANRLFVMAAAFFAGILITGWVADFMSRRGVSLLKVVLAFIVLFMTTQLGIILEIKSLELVLWSLFGMTGQAAVIAFPWLASYYGAERSGRANSGINLPMFLFAFLFQYAIGAVIDLYPTSGTGGYAPEGYRMAFGLLLALQVLALIWYLMHTRVLAQAEHRVLEGYKGNAQRS